MRTKEDVEREVEPACWPTTASASPASCGSSATYFDYDLGGYICKDTKALRRYTGVSTEETSHYRAMFDATASTDRLIELILQEDKDVFKQLLTTDKVVATRDPDNLLRQETHQEERQATAVAAAKKAEDAEQIIEEVTAAQMRRN